MRIAIAERHVKCYFFGFAITLWMFQFPLAHEHYVKANWVLCNLTNLKQKHLLMLTSLSLPSAQVNF